MEVALFSTGPNTILAVKYEDGRINKQNLNSLFIFQDPNLVFERLLLVLKYQFHIQDPYKITSMSFGLSGIINVEKAQIIKSTNLNSIAMGKNFSGFSFKKIFGEIVGEENIYAFNDAQAIGLGIRELIKDFNSAIVFMIDKSIGISHIDEKGFVHETELGSVFIPREFNVPAFMITGEALYELMYTGCKDVFKKYTEKLIRTVLFFIKNPDSFIKSASKIISGLVVAVGNLTNIPDTIALTAKKYPASKVFVWSVYEEFIDKELLKNAGFGEIIQFPSNEEEKFLIPILGCFAYSKQKNSTNRKIIYIEYVSAGRIAYDFKEFVEFENHWKSNNSFANPDNEYHMHYNDGSIKIRRMGDITSSIDLEEFIF